MRMLAVNAGSTSLKVASSTDARDRDLESLEDRAGSGRDLDVVRHRVVHGGDRTAPALVDDELLAELRALIELAPLHQPPALERSTAAAPAWPDVPQFACFDTAFHATMPRAARTYALPARCARAASVVYGFHGLSHAWSAGAGRRCAPGVRRRGRRAPGRRRVALRGARRSQRDDHDGLHPARRARDGDSLRARSTPAPCCGWRSTPTTTRTSDACWSSESGLLGLCGDADMRAVLARCDAGDTDARLAVDVYVHRLVTGIGGCVAALGGLDALVFTGGIGEHAPEVRELAAARLEWLGLALDDRPSAEPVREITGDGASVRTFVVEAREDLEMAEQVAPLLGEVSDRTATRPGAAPS